MPHAVLIILAIIAVSFISYWNGQSAVNEAARQLRSEAMLGLKQHLLAFLKTPHRINQINAVLIEDGQLNLGNPEEMMHYFLHQVMIHSTVSSIYFGNAQGGMVGSGRNETDHSYYLTRTVNFENGEFEKLNLDDQENLIFPAISSIPNFDTRTRPWYAGAVKKGGETWSSIYVLITGQDMAIAASRPVFDDNEDVLGVVSVDIFLSQISDYLETLSIAQMGQVFIMEQSGELVATSIGEPLFQDNGTGKKVRVSALNSQSVAIQEAGQLLYAQHGGYQNIPNEGQEIDFMLGDEHLFMQYLTVSDPYGLHWIVAVIIPEDAFMGQIQEGNQQTLQLTLVALLLAVAVSVVISKKISNRIGELDRSARALANGDWDQTLVENTRIVEMKTLAESFNKMKEQLRQSIDSLAAEVQERKQAEQKLEAEVVRRRLLFEESPDGILIIDAETTRFLEFNTAAHTQLGYSREEFANLGIDDVNASESQEETRKRFESFITEGRIEFETRHRTRNGDIRDVHVKAQVINTDGEPIHYCIWRDITEQKKLALELQKNHDFLARVFETMGQGLTITDSEGRFEFINPAYAHIFGYKIEDLIGRFPYEFTLEEDREVLKKQRELRKTGQSSTYESRLVCADGRIANVLITGVPRECDGGKGAISVITDLSEQKRIEKALRETTDALELALLREQQLARTDELTKINNRRSVFELADFKFEVAKRYNQPLAMIIFDVDHFKKINDVHGHLAGDQALVEVTKSVQAQLRNADVFGRYGGEEFVILLPMTNAKQASILAERIRKNIENFKMKTEKGSTVSVTVSLGIAEINTSHKDETVEKLFSRADEAMYQAKHAGRNCSRIFDAHHVSS